MIHALAFYTAWIAPWIYTLGAVGAVWLALRAVRHEQKHADEMFSILQHLSEAQQGHIEQTAYAFANHKTAIEQLRQAEHEIKRVVMMQDAPRLLKSLQDAGREREKETKPN